MGAGCGSKQGNEVKFYYIFDNGVDTPEAIPIPEWIGIDMLEEAVEYAKHMVEDGNGNISGILEVLAVKKTWSNQ